MSKPQFHLAANDQLDFDLDNLQTETLLAGLLAIEKEHPGFLLWILRTSSLVNADFQLSAKTSNRAASMSAQEDLRSWLNWYQSEILGPDIVEED